MEKIMEKIVEWIKERVKGANAEGVLVGLSGGIDSSCVAVLCKKAFPENTLGIIMPCISSPQDMEDAKLVAKKFDIPIKIIDLEESFKSLFNFLEKEEYNKEKHNNIPVANIKPRLRMTTLYYFANKFNCLVVGTDNKTESMLCYFTKYGDGGVDILPISDLYKKDVRKLARHLGISEEIITKKPSAGLWEGQTDEGEIGLTYEEIDEILERIEIGKYLSDIEEGKVKKIKEFIKISKHKGEMPPKCNLK